MLVLRHNPRFYGTTSEIRDSDEASFDGVRESSPHFTSSPGNDFCRISVSPWRRLPTGHRPVERTHVPGSGCLYLTRGLTPGHPNHFNLGNPPSG